MKIKSIVMKLLVSIVLSMVTILFLSCFNINNEHVSTVYILLMVIFINLFVYILKSSNNENSKIKITIKEKGKNLLFISIFYFLEIIIANNICNIDLDVVLIFILYISVALFSICILLVKQINKIFMIVNLILYLIFIIIFYILTDNLLYQNVLYSIIIVDICSMIFLCIFWITNKK